jgi:hypothetical protein
MIISIFGMSWGNEMNKRIRKKKSKRLTEIMQELNVLGLMSGRKSPDNLWEVPGREPIDRRALRRVMRARKKDPSYI